MRFRIPLLAAGLIIALSGCADIGDPQRQNAHHGYASAHVHRLTRLCKASYETRDGWSPEVLVEVQFVTGNQLNQAAKTFSYGQFSNYALIWFDVGQVAILECQEPLFGVGNEFRNDEFRNLFLIADTADFEQVNSDHARKWRIKGKEFFRFIDPRADQ